MTINVTQQHIDNGMSQCNIDNGVSQCNKCPIALAILEHLVKGLVAQVCDLDIRILSSPTYTGSNIAFQATTPKEAICFIYKFDGAPREGERPEPFSFELNIPEHLLCSQST